MTRFPRPRRRTRTGRALLALTVAGAMAFASLAGAGAVSAAPASAAEAGPVNLALTGTASASGTEPGTSYTPNLAIDGNLATRFSSNYADNAWFQVKLASSSPVDHIVINWPNACARSFIIQTSTDGTHWTDQKSFTDESTCPRVDTIQLGLTMPVSYVRMQGVKRWNVYGYSISEFEIYASAAQTPLPLVPEPVSVTRGDGSYTLSPDTQLVASGAALASATLLADQLRRSTGYALPIVSAATAPDPIQFVVAPGEAPAGHTDEGYTLKVTPDQVRIGADTAHGVLDGVQTLRQLLPQWIDSTHVVDTAWTVPTVSISDYPRFAYRGLMIDTARSFYTVSEVEQLIDAASRYKIDAVHLHLTDDQGWRIAMNTPVDNPSGIDYSKLTSVSGATAMTDNDQGQRMGTEPGHTGFYTQADYKDIVAYAADRGVTIVPEIDTPAHTNAALHAIPQLNGGGSAPALQPGETTVPANGTPDVGYSGLGANNPATYEFIKQVLTQLAAMTPGPYLHVGGDEAQVISSADYTKMVNAATSDASATGKTVIGWNEYAGTDLPTGSVVEFWNGAAAPVAAAVQHHDATVILAPAPKAYYPQKQDASQPQGGTWACGGPCTLENAYSWDPATYLAGVGESNVLGVEGAIWGEFIRGVNQAEFYAFPRVLATAEVGWSPQADHNTASFLSRLGQLGGGMQLQGVNFFPTTTVPWQAAAAGSASLGATQQASGGGAQARAEVTWTVTAPNVPVGQLTASVAWDGGAPSPVTLTGTQSTDIAAMTLNSVYTGTGSAALAPGAHTAVLTVTPAQGTPVSARVSVTVPEPSQPGGTTGGGQGAGGSPGTPGGTSTGAGGSQAPSGAVVASSAGHHTELASTGSDVAGLLAAAVLTLILGVALTGVALRRRLTSNCDR